jgi:H+/Cl- antiporter ClcA
VGNLSRKEILDPLARRFNAFTKKTVKVLQKPDHLQTLAFWVAAFFSGLVSVIYTKFFKVTEGWYHSFYAAHAHATLVLTPICFLISWVLVRTLAPGAAGSGIPQVLAANTQKGKSRAPWVDRLLSGKVILVKIASSLACLAGGGVIGREGPTIHVSTSIFHLAGNSFRRFFPKMEPHPWIVAGAAAGLASAFNTPLGGIVFAIEELKTPHFNRFKTVLLTSIIMAGLVSQWLLGPYLYLGYPSINSVGFSELPNVLLVGLLGGGFGALFGRCLKALVAWRLKIKGNGALVLVALGCGLALSGLALWDPQAAGSGSEVTNALLFHGQVAKLQLPLLRFCGSALSYLAGGGGGIFAPSLAAGASMGSYLSSLLTSGAPHLLILVGMASFLTGVTRTPFTAFVLVVEMSNEHECIFPLMLSALIADLVARLDHGSFYEWAKKLYLPKQNRA